MQGDEDPAAHEEREDRRRREDVEDAPPDPLCRRASFRTADTRFFLADPAFVVEAGLFAFPGLGAPFRDLTPTGLFAGRFLGRPLPRGILPGRIPEGILTVLSGILPGILPGILL